MMDHPERTAELVARTSYGRLLAYLTARSGDVVQAEDALSDAFAAALVSWPAEGVPERPEAWLLVAARRRLIDQARRHEVREQAALQLYEAMIIPSEAPDTTLPDERLGMLFMCAHPLIAVEMRTPLMLQLVLGLDANTIASAFLTSPSTMGQRLVRAKSRIREAGIRLEVPAHPYLPMRLPSVLDAIYAAYGTAWDAIEGVDERRRLLHEEAIWLARLLVEVLPAEPEPRGLLALMLYCESRREARRAQDGRYIPLKQQNPDQWNRDVMEEAESMLSKAALSRTPGRYQLEAAIQSAHALGVIRDQTDWQTILLLYEGLYRVAPSAGSYVGRAAAAAEVYGARAAFELLEAMPRELSTLYQPFFALRGHLLNQLGRFEEAAADYRRAAGLTTDKSVRDFLLGAIQNR